jgi:hypothetical protein
MLSMNIVCGMSCASSRLTLAERTAAVLLTRACRTRHPPSRSAARSGSACASPTIDI